MNPKNLIGNIWADINESQIIYLIKVYKDPIYSFTTYTLKRFGGIDHGNIFHLYCTTPEIFLKEIKECGWKSKN